MATAATNPPARTPKLLSGVQAIIRIGIAGQGARKRLRFQPAKRRKAGCADVFQLRVKIIPASSRANSVAPGVVACRAKLTRNARSLPAGPGWNIAPGSSGRLSRFRLARHQRNAPQRRHARKEHKQHKSPPAAFLAATRQAAAPERTPAGSSGAFSTWQPSQQVTHRGKI